MQLIYSSLGATEGEQEICFFFVTEVLKGYVWYIFCYFVFFSRKESSFETRKNVFFNFIAKTFFVLDIFKFYRILLSYISSHNQMSKHETKIPFTE